MAALFQPTSYAANFGMTPTEVLHHPRIHISDADSVTSDTKLDGEIMEALRAQDDVELVEHAVMQINFACADLILRGRDQVVGATRARAKDVISPWSATLAQGS